MNLFIIDIETSRLDPEQGEILEIGAVNVATGETFEVKVRPMRIGSADPKALEVNGYNEKDWEESLLLPHALLLLDQFVGKDAYFMAWNATFDWSFLGAAYRAVGTKSPFSYHHLDLMSVFFARNDRVSSLGGACLDLDIPPEPMPHRALAGALTAYKVYQKIV